VARKRVAKAKERIEDDRHRQFAEEFASSLNASDAYRTVYGNVPNPGPVACRLLKDVNIKRFVTEALAERRDRTQLRADRVVLEAAIIALSDITNYGFTGEGYVCLSPDAPKDAMRAVKSLKRRPVLVNGEVHYETEITLWDKNKALDTLGKLLGVFPQAPKEEGEQGAIQITLTDIFLARERAKMQLQQVEGEKPKEVTGGE
jgi:phage terminase small subunit